MSQPSVVHNTFVIERTYLASPERVFAAFADAASKRRWFAEGSQNHEVTNYELDFRVGGAERAEYRFNDRSPFPGALLTSEGVHLDIVPGRRIVIASTMAMGGNRFSASMVTAEILPADQGATLILTHQGAFFEGADGPERREAGWVAILDRLAKDLAR